MDTKRHDEKVNLALKKNGGIAALLASFGATWFLASVCLSYFRIMMSVATMGSRVDGRAGLWEIESFVPWAMAIAVSAGLMAAKLGKAKRLASYLALVGFFCGAGCFVLAYFIQTSLRR